MGPGLTIVIAFTAAVGLIGLAVWIWRYGQASTQVSLQDPRPPALEVPSARAVSGEPPASAGNVTRAIDERTQLVAPGFDLLSVERTQYVPPPAPLEEATQPVPAPPPMGEATQFIPPPISTEVVPREEIDAVIAQHRAQLVPAVPAQTEVLPRPAPFPRTHVLPRPAPPPQTEVLPRPAFEEAPTVERAEPIVRPIEPPQPARPSKPIDLRANPPLPHSEPRSPIPGPPKEFELLRAPPPSISAEILTQHFEAALRAFGPMLGLEGDSDLEVRMQAEREWRQHVEVLGLTAERSTADLVWPTLIDVSASLDRRKAAALILLELEAAKGYERLLERFAELDEIGREAAILGLTLWTSPRAEATTLKGWQAADELEQQKLWLRVFVDRAADPGPAVILETSQPELLAIWLTLLPFHAQGREHAARIDRHVLPGDASIRTAAIRAGLVFERIAPWLACKQASRDHAFPEICLLYAVLAPVKELEALSAWAKPPTAPAHAGWALGVSGRRVGMEGCLARLDHDNPDVVAKALAGFRHATGYAGPEEARAVREWWNANEARFDEDNRYLDGQALTLASARRVLATGSSESRNALRLELLVRSGGRVRLPALALPSREQELFAGLEGANVDLVRAWGPK